MCMCLCVHVWVCIGNHCTTCMSVYGYVCLCECECILYSFYALFCTFMSFLSTFCAYFPLFSLPLHSPFLLFPADGVSLDPLDTPISLCFGPSTAGWSGLTAHVLTRGGQLLEICPIVPLSSHVAAPFIDALLDAARDDAAAASAATAHRRPGAVSTSSMTSSSAGAFSLFASFCLFFCCSYFIFVFFPSFFVFFRPFCLHFSHFYFYF